MTTGVPYPPVAPTPLVDRRFDQILGELETIRRKAADFEQLAEQRDRTQSEVVQNAVRIYGRQLQSIDESIRRQLVTLRGEIIEDAASLNELLTDQHTELLETLRRDAAESRERAWSDFWLGAWRWLTKPIGLG